VIISLGAFASSAVPKSATEDPAIPAKTENQMTDEEMSQLIKRVEEIRDMDKTELTAKEKRALKTEMKEMKKAVKERGGYVYIGGASLILIILLIILLV
jgi:Zn-dependent M32 family carboxypeptidase